MLNLNISDDSWADEQEWHVHFKGCECALDINIKTGKSMQTFGPPMCLKHEAQWLEQEQSARCTFDRGDSIMTMARRKAPWQTRRGQRAFKQILEDIEKVKDKPGRATLVEFFRSVLRLVEKRLSGDFDGTHPLTDEELAKYSEARAKVMGVPELRLEEGRKLGYFPPA